jgi:ubiquinone/menaquinone biosynthesis C-methylase UbiE
MIARVLEPELMDTPEDATEYDSMDHREVNRLFVSDLLAAVGERPELLEGEILDLGTGTAQIPVEFCRQSPEGRITAADAAIEMLELARYNLELGSATQRVRLDHVDAKSLPYAAGRFSIVMSNSIVHHIPEPATVIREAVRVVMPAGMLFFRDLLRPDRDEEVRRLVDQYAAGCTDHQRAMFDASLRAALTLDEVRSLVVSSGFLPESVAQTSDRHWTWVGFAPDPSSSD